MSKRLATCASAALILGACGAATSVPRIVYPANERTVYVALAGALTGESGYSVEQAFEGVRLALQRSNDTGGAPVLFVPVIVDTTPTGSSAASLIQQVVSNRDVVAAVIWTSTSDTGPVAGALSRAGIPFIDLSPAEPGASWPGSIRMVGNDAEQAAVDAAYMARVTRTACVVGDGQPRDDALTSMISGDLRADGVNVAFNATVAVGLGDYSSQVRGIEAAGCGAVFWAGGPRDASDLRAQMTEAGLRKVVLVGTDEIQNDVYLSRAAGAGQGTVTSCPCADVTRSTVVPVEAFIQAYQARYGTPPGVFSVEGWDSGEALIAAARSGSTDRTAISRFLSSSREVSGVARAYAFQSDGALASGTAVVCLHVDLRQQWLPIGGGSAAC